MKENEVTELLKYLTLEYPSFKFTKERLQTWYEELQQYDTEDVKARVRELTETEQYAVVAPTLNRISSGLTKKQNKVNFKKMVLFCNHCNRCFNTREELLIHEDRCRSIRYIISQYKKYNLGEIDKKTLYQMSDKTFNEKYEKLLIWIKNHTNDDGEKTRIEFVFNPPSWEKAKEFLGV